MCLEKLAFADSVAARGISNIIFPRFFESEQVWRGLDAGSRLVHSVLCIRDHASALLPLCSAPAAVCSLSSGDPMSGRVRELMRICLYDARSHTARKRAQHLVSVTSATWEALGDAVGWKEEQWCLFCGILDACEDTSSHLINAAWDQIHLLADSRDDSAEHMLWLEALFSRALQHQKVAFRQRALRSIAAHPRGGRFSRGFIIEGILAAADDAQLLKASKLNSENPLEPVVLTGSLDGPCPTEPSIAECIVRIIHRQVKY